MSDHKSDTTILMPRALAIRRLAVRMAQEMNVHSDRAEIAIKSLLDRGLFVLENVTDE